MRRWAGTEPARSSCSPRWGSASEPSTYRRISPAASSSAWRSRALAVETGNLDTATGGEIIELLASLAAEHGSTAVVATHDASLAGRAPRRIAMRDGRLIDAATPVLA